MELDLAGRLETAAVALRLLEGGGDVDVLALRLDRTEREEADEEDVVGRAGGGRPFRDGHVLALLGACSFREAQVFRIDDPAGLAELLVDQPAGRGFVEVDVGCRGGGGLDERRDRLGRSADGLGLLGGEARLEGRFFGFRLGGHAFPERLLVLRGLELFLQCAELPGVLVVGGLVVGQLRGEGLQLGAEFVGLVLRALEDADVRGDHLGEDFGELPELEEAGIRVLREVTLGQHPETQELPIVRLQMGEVAAEAVGRFGRAWHVGRLPGSMDGSRAFVRQAARNRWSISTLCRKMRRHANSAIGQGKEERPCLAHGRSPADRLSPRRGRVSKAGSLGGERGVRGVGRSERRFQPRRSAVQKCTRSAPLRLFEARRNSAALSCNPLSEKMVGRKGFEPLKA